MENATNALLMAGGILIGILILSLGAYLFVSFSGSVATMQSQIEQDQVNNFNAQFLKYDGEDTLTLYDVYTVAHLASDNNKKYEVNSPGESNYITVSCNTKGNELEKIDGNNAITLEDCLNDIYTDSNPHVYVSVNRIQKKYICKVHISEVTAKVDRIDFTYKPYNN